MNKHNEMKYISRLNLTKLKRVPSGYVCSCPVCREGSSPWKTRLYILTENKSYISCFCQHCNYSTNLRTFIKDFFPYVYEEYQAEEKAEFIEDLKNGALLQKEKKREIINTNTNLKYQFKLNQKYFKPAREYSAAYEFCQNRHILEHIDRLYYNIHPTHILSGMVIFPFLLEDSETLYGFQGRSASKKLFHTISKNEGMKVFNLFHVDKEKPVYIFESIIDSLMVPNSIAMMGTSLNKTTLDTLKHPIYVCDNDKAGKKSALKYLREGYQCLIYPSSFKYKDFNEAVVKGYNKDLLPKLICDNISSGLLGETKINFQLMGKR